MSTDSQSQAEVNLQAPGSASFLGAFAGNSMEAHSSGPGERGQAASVPSLKPLLNQTKQALATVFILPL